MNLEFSCLPEGPGIDLAQLAQKSPPFRTFLEGGQRILLLRDTDKLGYALKDLISELKKPEAPDEYLLDLLFARLLIELSNCSIRDSRVGGAVYLKKATAYIEEHLFEALTVSSVAQAAGRSANYLQRLFSSRFGCGITSYVNQKRMEHAAFLLENSRKSIVDIACELGYNSRQHFAYLFRRHYRVSPAQYRKLAGRTMSVDTGASQVQLDGRGSLSRFYTKPD